MAITIDSFPNTLSKSDIQKIFQGLSWFWISPDLHPAKNEAKFKIIPQNDEMFTFAGLLWWLSSVPIVVGCFLWIYSRFFQRQMTGDAKDPPRFQAAKCRPASVPHSVLLPSNFACQNWHLAISIFKAPICIPSC